jgi:hypothetical protein
MKNCRSTPRHSENAIVIGVDEKPSIQALEPAQGYLKLSGSDRPQP